MQPKRMLDFNSFLSKWKPVTFEESLIFVKKVKARDQRLYLSLFNILGQREQKSQEIYHDLLRLFENHDDLRRELMRFKPHDLDRRNDHQSPIWILLFFLPVIVFSFFLMFEHPLRYIVQESFGS